jgi:Xaa-Pro aminopeptidase
MNRLSDIQSAIRSEGLDGWLLYDFRGLNPIAHRVADIPADRLLTRRWGCFIPAHGAVRWLFHSIEIGGFRDLAPEAATYISWADWREGLRALMGGASLVAMEVSPGCAIPYVSRVDAGTVDLVRSLGVEVVSSADLVQVADAVWSPAQLASHRRAAASVLAVKDAAFAHVRERLAAGLQVTEVGLQGFILAQFAARGLVTADPPIVAVNAHAADPHYGPRRDADTLIRLGDLLLIDQFAREDAADAIYADITWMAYLGGDVPSHIRQVFETVRAARDAAVAFARERLRAGQPVCGYEVDDASREVITQAGFGPYFTHRTGHSLGTSVHYNGVNIDNLETQDRRRLIPGVGFTIEPGIYLPDEGIGVRLEINCHVNEHDLEVTTLPLQDEIALLQVTP